MATTSGASHAIAAFMGILISGLISDLLGTYATAFTDLGGALGEVVMGVLGVSLPATTTGHLLVATGLAFAWGVAYHYARHGTEIDPEGETETPTSPISTPRDVDVPEVLAGIVTSEYVADEIHTADKQVQSHLSTVLADEIKPRLADTAGCNKLKEFATPGWRISLRTYSRQYESHDRLVANDQRDLAEQISSVESDIDRLERSLSSISADTIVTRNQVTQLKGAHVTLVESATELKSNSETLLSASKDGDVESAITNCRDQYRLLRDAHETRQRIIDQSSVTP